MKPRSARRAVRRDIKRRKTRAANHTAQEGAPIMNTTDTTAVPCPLPPDYVVGDARRELAAAPPPMTVAELRELVGHVANSADAAEAEVADGHVAIVLDWAAELRRLEGLTWGQALRAASIFYFG